MNRAALVFAVVLAAGACTSTPSPTLTASGSPTASPSDVFPSQPVAQAVPFPLEATIPELQAAMESGELTSLELVDFYLARIAAYDDAGPMLNAFIYVNPAAREQAAALDAERAASGPSGPLHGIPIVLKDNINTADMPTTAGSRGLEGFIPSEDAFQVRKLREAGHHHRKGEHGGVRQWLSRALLAGWADVASVRPAPRPGWLKRGTSGGGHGELCHGRLWYRQTVDRSDSRPF